MKTKQTVLSLVTIICLLLANFSTVLAGGPPGLPSSFYGTALVDGVAVPEDTVITAWINGVQYGTGLVKLVESQLGYSVDVLADDASTPEKEGGVSGDTVVFKIGGVTAGETGTWNVGNAQLNLTAWNEYTLTSPVNMGRLPGILTSPPIMWVMWCLCRHRLPAVGILTVGAAALPAPPTRWM